MYFKIINFENNNEKMLVTIKEQKVLGSKKFIFLIYPILNQQKGSQREYGTPNTSRTASRDNLGK